MLVFVYIFPAMADELVANLVAVTGKEEDRCAAALVACEGDFDAAVKILENSEQSENFDHWESRDATAADLEAAPSPFTDPVFPPSPLSLASLDFWTCPKCHFPRNSLPAPEILKAAAGPTAEEIRELFNFISFSNPLMAAQLRQSPAQAPAALAAAFRSQLLLGKSDQLDCQGCKAKSPIEVLNLRASQWLRPASLRDELTGQTDNSVQWLVFRGLPQPDDVVQGLVGNCWFIAALSLVAGAKPEHLISLFPGVASQNPKGAYLVRLCRDGAWRTFLLDDNLPATPRNFLAFTKSTRKQLWAPLLEKACARAAGCYEALHGGTFREAFALLTGSPTETVDLRNVHENLDEIWTRLLSACQAGFLIGACCVPTGKVSLEILNSRGLQAPHGYAILKIEELNGHRLLRLRNPWGERAPQTWKGRWRADGPEWNSDLRIAAGLTNVHGVYMHNTFSDFWIEWEDFSENFAVVEICRFQNNFSKRASGWLPALSGFGNFFEVETKPGARVDISIYQEIGKKRGGGYLIDLGFIVLDEFDNPVIVCRRARTSEVSAEGFLEPGKRYFIIPLSFGSLQENLSHRKIIVAVHSNADDLEISSLPLTKSELGIAVFAYAKFCSPPASPIPGVQIFSVIDAEVGLVLAAENITEAFTFSVMADAADSSGVLSSRGALLSEDLLAPKSRAVLGVITVDMAAKKSEAKLSFTLGARFAPSASTSKLFPPTDLVEIHLPVRDAQAAKFREFFCFYLSQGVSRNEAEALALEDAFQN